MSMRAMSAAVAFCAFFYTACIAFGWLAGPIVAYATLVLVVKAATHV